MTEVSGRYRLTSDDVVCENFDGEYVVLNLESGHYYAVSRSASVFLDGLLKGFDAGQMAGALGATNGRASEVANFLEGIVANGIVVPDDQPPEPVTAEWKAQAATANDALRLDVFDDLADLITADPIHDTIEDAGWPVLKTEHQRQP